MEWKKAKKKPVVIEYREVMGKREIIPTREGILTAILGRDYIIKGIEAELYPITKEIFDKTYDRLDNIEFKEKMKEEGSIVKQVDYVGDNKVREEVSCYTCSKCDTFFDRDYDVYWREPVEVGDKIYCGDCYKRMKK